MGTFERQMAETSLTEGGYVNDPLDPGGETNHGITVAVARAFGYRGAMRDLTADMALEIYRARYWIQPSFDQIDPIHPELAAWLLDTGINMGPAAAGKMLQRWLNALNDGGRLYPDLAVDGMCGALTRHALTVFLSVRGSEGRDLLPRLCRSLQAARYLEIAEKTPSQERFEWGWVKRALRTAALVS
jgi:lysozyme family protein